jgi:hypothetical protein
MANHWGQDVPVDVTDRACAFMASDVGDVFKGHTGR